MARRALLWARQHWSALLVALLVLGIGVAGIVVPGNKITDVHLDDASVVVTKRDTQLVGTLNYPNAQIAMAAPPYADRDFTVYQSGATALVRSNASGQLQQYDLAGNQLGQPVVLPGDSQVSLQAGRLAVSNATNGRVWFGPLARVLGIDFAKADADLEAGPGAKVTLTAAGDVVALSVRDNAIERPGPKGTVQKVALPFTLGTPLDVELSSVGDKAVVLDRRSNFVWIEGDGGPTTLLGGVAAHLAGPAARSLTLGGHEVRAVVATPAGLAGVRGRNDVVNLTPDLPQADPLAPVVVGGCAYGSFGPRVAVACEGAKPRIMDTPSYAGSASLEFRTNHGIVVLNDTLSGRCWLPDKNMRVVDNWKAVTPDKTNSPKDDYNDQTEQVPPDRTKPNRPPVAKDDDLTVRAGRSTLLPVLDNDSDPDGDIIEIDQVSAVPVGTLSTVRGGTGLQFAAPDDAAGKVVTFHYRINDGRGLDAGANVTIHVVGPNQAEANRPPRQYRTDTHLVALNGKLSLRVLDDWRDPEGDDLVLTDAKMADGSNDEVTFTPDGVLTYTDVGTKTGRKVIKVWVSDGKDTTQGEIVVDARKGSAIPPVANGDYYQASVGKEIVLKPLQNDIGEGLLLSWVNRNQPGAIVTPNFDDGTIRFAAKKPGTYYLDYIVSTGPTAFGLIRVDVTQPEARNRPPVAVRDVALLPAGGTVLVDPLLNDEDPDGDVLVLQSITSDPALSIEVTDRHLVSIRAVTAPRGPVTLTYVVSDGTSAVPGQIVVIPSTGVGSTLPVAVPDEVTVRANDTVSVDVLHNDYSPVGSTLTLAPTLVETPGPRAWVDGDQVRFTAPSAAGSYRAVYEVRDEFGRKASAFVRFTVIAANAENRAPVPQDVTGRVLAGATMKIAIPLDGIDPNGDSVRLLGLDSGPQLGRITSVGEHWLEYQAYPSARGTDTFTYVVTDGFGAKGVGTIRVGVIGASQTNHPPTAVDDRLTVRPGRTVNVPALANDSDLDGDLFGFVPDSVAFKEPHKIVNNAMIQVQVPDKAGLYQGTYTIEDQRGLRSSANVVITADPKAPLLPIVTRDDVVAASDVAGKDVIDVPVLANDYDPDGSLDDPRVTVKVTPYDCVKEECAEAVEPKDPQHSRAADKVVRVHVGATMKLIRYEVTDADGNVSFGMIVVPGRADTVPALRADVPELEVVAGDPLDIDINQYVLGTRGRSVVLTSDERVWGSAGARGQALSPKSVRFVSAPSYSGPAAIAFEVTDGRNASDPEGKTAVLEIPIKVKPRPTKSSGGKEINQPPVANPVELQIGPGEETRTKNLLDAASDPDGDSLHFSEPRGDAPAGMHVAWDGGSILSASADVTVPPGTKATYTVQVTDSKGSVTPMQIAVVVVESSRPRASVQDDTVPDANQGKSVTVSPLVNDTSPFPDKPLRLIGAVVEFGSASGVGISGDTVTFTPEAVGNLIIRYTVGDATESPNRYVDGRIRVNVRGVPGPPGVVRLSDTVSIDQQLTVTWTAAIDNGAPIDFYTVTARGDNGSTASQRCESTTCTITGLTNGVRYTMAATATNEVGVGPASPDSAQLRPDRTPPQPNPPRTQFGDRQIAVSWDAITYGGTPIVMWRVRMIGDVQRVQEVKGGTSTTFDGLTNGASYRFQVQAVNDSGLESPWSELSPPEVPAGRPGSAAPVTAVDSGGRTGGAVDVTWKLANPNGDDPDYVIAAVADNGTTAATFAIPRGEVQKAAGDPTSGTFHFPVPNGRYTFSVMPRNKAGEGPVSASELTYIYGNINLTEAPSLIPGDRTVEVRFPQPQSNGADPTSYTVDIGGKQLTFKANAVGRAPDGRLSVQVSTAVPIVNGTPYSATVSVCTAPGGGAGKCSDAPSPASTTEVPYGSPGTPTAAVELQPTSQKNGDSDVMVAKASFPASYNSQTQMDNGTPIAGLQINTGAGWVPYAPGTQGPRVLPGATVQAKMVHGQPPQGATPSLYTYADSQTDTAGPVAAPLSGSVDSDLRTVKWTFRYLPAGRASYTCHVADAGTASNVADVTASVGAGGTMSGQAVLPAAIAKNGRVRVTCDAGAGVYQYTFS